MSLNYRWPLFLFLLALVARGDWTLWADLFLALSAAWQGWRITLDLSRPKEARTDG